MRAPLVILLVVASFMSFEAHAATLTNRDSVGHHVIVCDEGCRRADRDTNSQRDFWLGPGESRTFSCYDRCFVGIYRNGAPPPIAEMAVGGDNAFYRGDEVGEIIAGQVRRRR